MAVDGNPRFGRSAISGLALLALSLSSYLAWHSLMGGSVVGCSVGSACDTVLSSRWSSFPGGLPIAGFAVGLYLATFMASLYTGKGAEESVRQMAWRALFLFAGVAAGAAIWFTYVQKWQIRAFCPYCMATHVTGLLLAILVVCQAPKRGLPLFGFVLAGVGISGIVAASQTAFAPLDVFVRGDSHQTLPALDLHNSPLVGPPDAPYVVTVLYDYKCPHCQRLHSLLDGAVRSYGGKLAFVLCPTPLSTKCNPYVPMDVPEFAGSCDLTRVALTVWAAKRAAFPSFERWLYSFESGDSWQPRSLESARAKAIELVGKVQFAAASTGPWIDRYLHDSVQIYGSTVGGGNTAVPKMIYGSHWVIPQTEDADRLISILQKTLGLPAAALAN